MILKIICMGKVHFHFKTFLSEVKMYNVIRYYNPNLNKLNEIVKDGLTLAEAKEHCQDKGSRESGIYFDGYTEV